MPADYALVGGTVTHMMFGAADGRAAAVNLDAQLTCVVDSKDVLFATGSLLLQAE